MDNMFPKTLKCVKDDGTTPVEIQVRQIRLADYDRAMRCVVIDDEFGLMAVACGTSEAVIKSLSPESYELVQATVWEVNQKGFFTFARRRKASQAERNAIREMAAQVLASPAVAAQISAQSSHGSPPRPA
jgi:hypothetical protein